MGTIQVPGRLSGRTYTVDIAGDTPSETEQARIRAMVEERENRYVQRFSEQFGFAFPAPDDGTAFGRGLARTAPQIKSTLGTTIETVGQQLGLAGLAEYGRGMEQDAARRLFDLSLQQPAPTTREDVAAAQGFFPTIGAGLTYAGELAGEQAGQFAASLAGGGVGAVAGGLTGGIPGALVGFGVGAGLTEAPLLFGANVQRQEEEVAAGRKESVDLTDALAATVGQASLTAVTNALAGAGVFLRPGARLFTRAASGAVVGGTTESLNEIGQQMFERHQAGLPIDSPDAIKEYIDAGVAGGILGIGAGGLGGIAGRGPAAEERAAPPAEEAEPPEEETPPAAPTAEITEQDLADIGAQETPPPAVELAPVDEGRPMGGVSIDEDLAEARAVYDERLAIAEEGGTDPEEAQRIAAQAAVNYVDSLQEDTRKRLERFRNTMARLSAGPTRGVMQPDIPDEAYAQEFGEAVQKDLFAAAPTAPEAVPAPQPEVAAQVTTPEVPTPKYRQAAEAQAAETRPAVSEAGAPKPAQVLTEETVDRLGVGKAKSARLRKLVGTPLTDTKVIQALNSWAQNDRATPENKALAARLITGQPEPEVTPAPEVENVTQIAEAQPEAVGTGIPSGEPSVGRGRGGEGVVPTPEGVEAPAGGGLGGDLPAPLGTPAAEGVQPDTLSQLEEQLAAARARAAELRKQVPAGVLQRELVGGKIDPRLPKQVANLQNVLAQQRAAAESAKAKFDRTKVPGATRDSRLRAYEAALAKVNETQTQLAAVQDQLAAAELSAGLRRAAEPKAPMTDKAQSAYTAYFNALQDADILRQTLETERARRTVAPEEPAHLPTDLREPVIPDTFMTYQRGITSKPVRPSKAPTAVAEAMQKERMAQRLTQFFEQRATPALRRYTTAQGGINSPTTWKDFPDWMPLADQSKVVQLLGRLNRKEREKYKFPASEVEPLSPDAEAAHTYFSKTIRPVDAIDMMLDDLSADYEIYEGSLRPGLTEIEHRDLMMGTGSEVATRALNWVRANLSPETNAEVDLILKKQAENDVVTADWIGAEGTDRVAKGREMRKEAREARAKAAEESGYDAMSIVRKMVAGDSRVALDQEMHYSVKAALNAGDLKGALRSLADTTSNPELKDMASRFAGLVGTTRVRVLYPGDSAKYIGNDRGAYVQQRRADLDPDYQNIILINGQTGMTNHVLMHEMAHALSSRFIDENPNHPVVKQLRDLLTELRAVGPKQELFATGRGTARVAYPTDFYGLTNISEMVAEGYGRLAFGETDNGLRDLMKRTRLRDPVDRQVEFENPLNAWDRFKELVGNILNVIMRKPLTRRPRTKRIETVQVYETAADRFHRLVDGLLSEAPQVLPESVLQNAVTKPMVAVNVLNNAVNNAPVWSPEGMSRLAQLMTTAIPQPLRRALLGLLQLDWFNDFAGKYFPQIAQLKEIDDLRRGKYQAFNKGVQGVMQDLLAFAQKSPELYNALMSILGQATLAGVDPTRPVSDYAGDKEKTAEWYNLNRQLTSPEMRKLFKQTRNVFKQFRDEIKRVLKARALDITNDEAKANNLVAQLLKKLDEENAIDPYFALMRTGDFWIKYTAEDTTAAPIATDPLGQMKRPVVEYVQAFTDPFARDRFRAKLEAARDANGNPIAWNITSMPRPTGDFVGGSAPSVAFAQGALNIISSFGGAGTSAAEQQKVQDATNAIQELFVRLTPDHSAMKAFIKRKGTRGFMGDITPLGVVDTPTDFIGALARKADGLAYQLINIEYGGKIQKLIDSAKETRNDLVAQGGLTEPEQSALDAYYAEFVDRAQLAKAPRVGAFGQFVRGITFGWTLGFNVAGAISNLAQLPMVGMTELAGRYGGLGSAKRELGFAMRVLKNAGKTERVVSYGPDGREIRELSGVDNYGSLGNYYEPVITVDPKTGQEVITSRLRTDMKIPEALRDKLANMDVLAEVMANHGMLNASMSQELLEAEAGWLHKINRWSGFLQHHAERFSRQSMAIAAYNLELGKLTGPATPAAKLAAAQKAIEITERVNGTIGAATAPRYAMSSFGSVVFMFKRFALHMTRYIVNTANQALRGASKEDRAVARYQITGMLGTTALFAGVQGLPFFSELMTLINLFFTDDDEERPEVLVQKFLGEPYYHGALNYLLGIDIASRISMSGLIFRENKIEKDQSIMYDAIEMFGGPAVGVFQNIERGINLINDGEFYRGVEAMSPSAIKSILKSFRFSTDGATTLRGDEVVPVTYADIIKQVLGYTPVDLARTQERVSGAKRLDEAIRNRKRKLLGKYNVALVDGDFSEVRDILQDMREFSRQYPEEAITSDTINRSHRSFLQRSEEMISGVSLTNRERGQRYIDEFDEDTTAWGSQ